MGSTTIRLLAVLLVLGALPSIVQGCAAQYKRELRYLDFYLGIQPTENDGELPVNDERLHNYAQNANELNCDFKSPCAWVNALSDDLSDTSDFYLFEKKDKKAFPVQLGPGNAHPPVGQKFILAGNTTNYPQSAVLVSAPIACQVSKGQLKFKYWLYNTAKVEIIILKINPSHGHLQVLSRPKMDCGFLKPLEQECTVTIDEMHEPFKIGIRVYQLHDPAVGSLALISDITYDAQLCQENEVPSLFGGLPLAVPDQNLHEIFTASDLDCTENVTTCLWAPYYAQTEDPISLRSLWQNGVNQRLWNDVLPSTDKSRPSGDFIFQYIDPMSKLPIGQLRSAVIPCTQSPSMLSFRYWMSPSVQAKMCTVGVNNVSLSCVFLSQENSPGPIEIEMNQGDSNPFMFVVEIIKFDESRASVFIIDDIRYQAILCHEEAPKTTVAPFGIPTLFEMQPITRDVTGSSRYTSIDCNFEIDQCNHWEVDENFQSGYVPAALPFKMDKSMRGNVIVSHFTVPNKLAVLTSPVISCAKNARVTVHYFSSLGARLSVCANERCLVERERDPEEEDDGTDSFGHVGELAVNITSNSNFQVHIIAESVTEAGSDFAESFVLIKKISSEGNLCRLKDKTELACEALTCDFRKGTLCNYKTALTSPDDVPFEPDGKNGVTVHLSTPGTRRVVLRSPEFQLSRPAELRFRLFLSTFGAVAHICPDEYVDNVVEDCELLAGPRNDGVKFEDLQVQLDPDVEHFAIVVFHDKYQQFGEAQVSITDIKLLDSTGNPLCRAS